MNNMEHDNAYCGDCSPLEPQHIAITSIAHHVISSETTIVSDCFDPAISCNAHEQAMIATLKAYLRPERAPECLLARLKATLDQCCGQE